ncbi:MAG TPA: PASTA domain-containing protein, partial [Kineosporiaceae bacterium]|nr:PASTA domain-containing protein [Kineosporiaceae bacterium]
GAAPQHTRPLPGVTRSGRRAAGQHDAGPPQRHGETDGRDGEDATLRELARQRRRRGRVGLAVVLVLTVVLGGVAWWFTGGPGAFRTVPPLTGLTLAEAKQQLGPLGLDAVPRYQHDETAPPGHVITTDPQAGQEIRRGGGVVLVFSDGPPRVGVPDVTGLTADQAAEKLAAGYLKTNTNRDWQFDDATPKGNVISTDPPANSQVDNGAVVTLTISKGPQPVDLPDMSGRSQDDALAQLQGLGFKPGIKQEFSDKVPAGTVISQDPHPGPASHGKSVQLTVSKGPQLFDVPDVFGKNVNDATKILTDAGFQVDTNKFMGGPFGLVRQQNPGAHSQQPKGTLITLTVV